MARPGFTFIELMIVVTIMLIVTSISVNAGVRGQQAAEFFGDFQNAVLTVQGARSQSLTDPDDRFFGHGVAFVSENGERFIRHFIDVDNDGLLSRPNSELISEVQMQNRDLFWQARGFEDFKLTRIFNDSFTNFTIFFPRQSFTCIIYGEIPAKTEKLAFLEVAFTNQDQDTFATSLATKPVQVLTFHGQSCIAEVSDSSVL